MGPATLGPPPAGARRKGRQHMTSQQAPASHVSARISRFVKKVEAKLAADEAAGNMRVVTDHRLRIVMEQCGFERRGHRNVGAIEAALLANGIYAEPAITTPGLDRDQIIYLSRTPPSPPEQRRLRWPAEY